MTEKVRLLPLGRLDWAGISDSGLVLVDFNQGTVIMARNFLSSLEFNRYR